MATAIPERVWSRARTHPRAVTAVLSAVGYVVVVGSFVGLLPLPDLDDATVLLMGDLIAVINTVALSSLLAGWWFIRRGQVDRHRRAMLTAFALIVLFLVVYVWKQAGGFTKEFVVREGQFLAGFDGLISTAYLGMLAVHVLLSMLTVPVVLHAVVLGLTHSPSELPDTLHPRVGRVAVAAWSLSLALGIVTYLMLNHVYGWEAARYGLVPLLGGPAVGRCARSEAARPGGPPHGAPPRQSRGRRAETTRSTSDAQ